TPTPTPTPTPVGNLNPKYIVLSVIYAPPGQKSSVDYGTSTMIGTGASFDNSFAKAHTVNTSFGLTGKYTCPPTPAPSPTASPTPTPTPTSTPVPCEINDASGSITGTHVRSYTQTQDTNGSILIQRTTASDIVVPGPQNSIDGI